MTINSPHALSTALPPSASLPTMLSSPWLIRDEDFTLFFQRLQAGLPDKVMDNLFELTDPVIDEMEDAPYEIDEEGTAHINFHGVAGKRLEPWLVRWLDMVDLDVFDAQISHAADNESVARIEIDFDSPGGSVIGVLESQENLRQATRKKPVIARCEILMASLAYFIGSQATSIVVGPSSMIGSIGAMNLFIDRSKLLEEYGIKIELLVNEGAIYKGANAMGKGLTKAQRDQFQERVQSIFDLSYGNIKAARPDIQDEYARGQVIFGHEAFWQGTGLVDDLIS